MPDSVNTKRGKIFEWNLEITLESDLCMATGEGFADFVDVDVCLDTNGLPYIPARRLKGCLRDAAEVVESVRNWSRLNGLFGKRGSAQAGSIRISDAVIHDETGKPLSKYVASDPIKVANLYTSVRAQTALVPGEGYVKDNSLRFIRVVNKYDPLATSDKPLSFTAIVTAEERYEALLSNAAKALRNIGYDRNRGFGAVRCELKNKRAHTQDPSKACRELPDEFGKDTRIEYQVKLKTPLMLPQTKAGESVDYVSGTSVLGFFAGRLAGSADFDDLFLSNKIKFSPLYLVDACGKRCKPAPAFVVEAKGGKLNEECYLYSDFAKIADEERVGATAKPQKDGFVDGNWHPVKVRGEVVYHHATSNRGENGGEDGATLYTQRCLSEGQVLAGFIDIDTPEHAERIASVLKAYGHELMFGRSKTAQYAHCELVSARVASKEQTCKIKTGGTYAFLLDSDVLLCDDDGHPSTSYETLAGELRKALGEESGAFELADVESGVVGPGTSLRCRSITGYNAKWHHKRPHARAIAAGSTVVFQAVCDASMLGEFYIGMRQAEGFGRVLVVDLGNITSPILQVTAAGTDGRNTQNAKVAELLAARDAIETKRSEAVKLAKNLRDEGYFSAGRMNPAFIGRVTMMVDESTNRVALDERINSIKQEGKKRAAASLVNRLRSTFEQEEWGLEKECLLLILTLAKYYAKQKCVTDQDAREGEDYE
jgi:CRISPR-associated protein Csx10